MKSMMIIFAYAVLGILFQCNFAGAEDITIYPTLPGTNIRDFSRPGVKINGNNAYQTLPGTNIRDFSKPGATLSLQKREG